MLVHPHAPIGRAISLNRGQPALPGPADILGPGAAGATPRRRSRNRQRRGTGSLPAGDCGNRGPKARYRKWPLGRDTGEALQMLSAAKQRGIRHTVRSIHHTRARLAGRRFARSADPTTCHGARIARWRVFASRFATPLSLGSAFIQQCVEISEPVGIQTRDS